MPSPFLRHSLEGGVPSGGDTYSFLQEKGETGIRVYQEDVLQGVVKQLNMTLSSGQEWVFQQDSVSAQKPRRLRSYCGGTFRPLSAPRIGPRGVKTSPLGTINCGLFWRTWLAKSVITTWTVWRDPSWKQRQRSPRRRCVPWQQIGRSVSRLASRQRAAILSGIIINKNLKLLLINYLARKVMFCFIFLLGHNILGTEFMTGLCRTDYKKFYNLQTKIPVRKMHQLQKK